MFPMIVGLVMVTSIPMPTAGHGNFVHVSVGIPPERTYDFHANITPGSTVVIALKIYYGVYKMAILLALHQK